MKAFIVIGDKTSHGGTVITCSSRASTEGRGWARVGDMVSCPRCKGVFPIVQGDACICDDGHAVAYDGCKTACGATLIASQGLSFTEPVSRGGPGAASGGCAPGADTLKKGFGHVGAGLAGMYQDEPAGAGGARFRGRFQLVDAATGEPVRSQTVRVRSTGGQHITGSTDEDGYTQWVERGVRESLAFDLV